jgi:hypothetical protein
MPTDSYGSGRHAVSGLRLGDHDKSIDKVAIPSLKPHIDQDVAHQDFELSSINGMGSSSLPL